MITPRPELSALPPYRPGRPAGLEAEALVNLAANENAWGPSPAARASLAAVALHRYPDMDGPHLLRSLEAAWGLRAGELVLGTGSGHLIKCLAEAFVRPGDLAVTVHPTFSLYANSVALMGGQVSSLPGDGHTVRFEELPELVGRLAPRLVFACSPNNPTGDTLDEATLDALLAVLPEDGLLVLDEAYVHFARRPPDAIERVRQGQRIAVLRTFSKAYGLAALRLGALLAPAAVVEAVRQVREPFPASSVAIVAAEAAVRDTSYLERVREDVASGREELGAALVARGFRVHRGEGNFVWAEVPQGSAAELTAALRRQGVLIRDGSSFGAPSHVRVSVGTTPEREALCLALDRLAPVHPAL